MGIQTMTEENAVVLVVDDEPSIRSLLRTVLAGSGYSVLTAAGGIEALDLLRRNHTIDLLISDFQMPGMDGLELYEAVTFQRPGTPVLFISGNGEAFRQRCSLPV